MLTAQVWEETCYIRVSPDAIKDNERVRITLWDSDRVSADECGAMT